MGFDKVGIDKVGIDKVGIDKVGIDQVGRYPRLDIVASEFWGGRFQRTYYDVLQCCSHFVWLVFEGWIPTCACFHSENVFVTCFCCCFF